MIDSIIAFWYNNPELQPVIYLLGVHVALYLVWFLVARVVIGLRGNNNRPFTDVVVHTMLAVSFGALSLAGIIMFILMLTNSMYIVLFYHWIVYLVFILLDIFCFFMLLGSLLTRKRRQK